MTTRDDFVITTERLTIRRANPDKDSDFYYQLWTNPWVMFHVGYPDGLPITRDEIPPILARDDNAPLDCNLVVEITETKQVIGEAKLGSADSDGIAHTDIKLLPQHWSKGYGTEIKRALLGWLFDNTDCKAVRATPNVENEASIKMQKRVGGRKVGEGTYEFPEHLKSKTRPVKHYIFEVTREDWLKTNQ